MQFGAATTKLHRGRDSQGTVPLKKDAKDADAVAGLSDGLLMHNGKAALAWQARSLRAFGLARLHHNPGHA